MRPPRKPLLVLAALLLGSVAVHASTPAARSDRAGGPAHAGPRAAGLERALAPAAARTGDGRAAHIVHLAGAPVAAYEGGVPGLPATSPRATGALRLDPAGARAVAYAAWLERRHDAFLQAAEIRLGRRILVTHRYSQAFFGMAAEVSAAEADALARMPGVVRVTRSKLHRIATDVGPRWIGAGGVWEGSAAGGLPGTKGEGVVVGVIDTGVNMDHPSFAGVGDDGYRAQNPLGAGNYLGFCNPAHPGHRPKHACNDKLIGAWSFVDSGNDPEDDNGHGSHTASTAAGNFVSATLFPGAPSATRTVSGVAPHANIVAYDACNGDGFCPDTATLAATDQAVRDGIVDVLNFSIGTGQDSPWQTPDEIAFLNARRAGIVVVAAAGNAGPDDATVEAAAPWIVSVGAATHDRVGRNALTLLAGGEAPPQADMPGLGYSGAYGPAPVVYALGRPNVLGNPDDGQCTSRFRTGAFDGEIVVCDRGGVDRVQKGLNVLAGGAGGMVLVNGESTGEQLSDDWHVLPAVHVGYEAGAALKSWLSSGTGHSARIEGTTVVESPPVGDVIGDFSSRGPTRASRCCFGPDDSLSVPSHLDLLKPDLVAPGVGILAATASDQDMPSSEPEWAPMDGTSMAAPHVAGAAALLRALHPEWSPAELQSSLMSTSSVDEVRSEGGVSPAPPSLRGAGRVDVAAAARAAVVFPIDDDAYESADPAAGGDPRAMNLPSLYDSACLASCGWLRTIESTLATRSAWTVTVRADDGLYVTVEPREFTLDADGAQLLTIDAIAAGILFDEWAFADVWLEPDDPDLPAVHMPLAVRSVQARAPELVAIEAASPSGRHVVEDLATIETADLQLSGYGFARGITQTHTLSGDPTSFDPFDLPPTPSTGVAISTVDVPEGALRLVAEVTASEADDVDLFVGMDVTGDGQAQSEEIACASAGPSWTEYCDVSAPDAGVWWIAVQNFRPSARPPDRITLASALVMPVELANMAVSGPGSASLGEPFDVAIQWMFPSIARGDRYYAGLAIGSSVDTPDDLALVHVNLFGMTSAQERTAIYLPATHANARMSGR